MSPKRSIDVERCFITMDKTIEYEKELYSSGYCRCHLYIVGDEIGRITESTNKPLNYCDKQATFINYSTTLYLFLEEWRVYLLLKEKK
jgi:hypothetical protein